MIMKAAGAGGGVVHGLTFGERRKPIPKWMWGAIGASLLFHGAAAIWIYNTQFATLEAPPVEAPPPGTIEILNFPRPEPTPNEATQPPIAAPIHDSRPAPNQPTSPFVPIEDPVIDPNSLYVPITPEPTAVIPTPEPTPVAPPVIRNPTWASIPTAREMERFYPKGATEQGLDGKATMSCTVTGAGKLTACSVVSETPQGAGFGEAILKLSPYFKMKPKTVDGTAVEGGQVKIPISFKLS
jgi:protein TonB